MSIISDALRKLNSGRKDQDKAVFQVSSPKPKTDPRATIPTMRSVQGRFKWNGQWISLGLAVLIFGGLIWISESGVWTPSFFTPRIAARPNSIQATPASAVKNTPGRIEFVNISTSALSEPIDLVNPPLADQAIPEPAPLSKVSRRVQRQDISDILENRKSAGPLTSPAEPYQLTGIVWKGATPFALINHRVVRVGDSVLQAKVKDIGEDDVILESANGLVRLSLP